MLSSTPYTQTNESKKLKDRSVLVKGVLLLAMISLVACGGGGSKKSSGDDNSTDDTTGTDTNTGTATDSTGNESGNSSEDNQETPEPDTDGDGVADSSDALPNDPKVTGIITIRHDIGNLSGAGGTEIRRYKCDTTCTLKDVSEDADSDSNPENVYHYNDNLQLVLHEEDADNNGLVEQTYTYSYNGSLRSSAVASGNIDNYTETYTYNSANQQTRTDHDRDSNGSIDHYDTYEYQPADTAKIDLVRQKINESDVAQNVIDYVYDPAGELTDTIFSNEESGLTTKTIAYTYHPNGLTNTVTIDEDADGNPEFLFNYYDNGALNTLEKDEDSDGSVDINETYLYDSGILVGIDRDTNNDTTVDERVTYTYLPNSRFDTITEDIDANGSIDITVTYHYTDGAQTAVSKTVTADSNQNEALVIRREGHLGTLNFYRVF